MTDKSRKISQLPLAVNAASTDRLVMLKTPVDVNSARTITVANLTDGLTKATDLHLGVVRVGNNISVSNGVIYSSYFDYFQLPPTTSLGKEDDLRGMYAVDNNYFYICTLNFTGNSSEIWKQLPFDTSNLVSNSQLSSNLANYQTTADLLSNVATLFGEGFSLTSSDKIVTNKLYSTNETQSTQHYRLTLDTNGVVHLPDESIINGATLKTVPGNYAGITAGPVGKDEDSWVWVDNDGTWIATDYSNNAFTWKFDNNGKLTLPGLLTLPVTNSIPQSTPPSGTVAVSDGAGWDPESDGIEHLMIYINGGWNKVV